ncbi:hypothetical protein AVEN_57112-1 [Araneus ventricosus]|uniref:Uncharacterized protein n=1 Tax=Araneus ventricosus TaxID=182803 RepID=A0A4Y2SS50_ARAVE|nr:hypothetical protein AVEN_57112-1 [Araneus ventricosus]
MEMFNFFLSILIKGNVCVRVCLRCPEESIALTAMTFGTQAVTKRISGLPKVGNSSVVHSIPFVPTLVFPHTFQSKNQARHSLEAPKYDITALRFPSYFLTQRISDWVASSPGPILVKSFDLPLPSHQGPTLESAQEVLEFDLVGNPAFEAAMLFSIVFDLDDCFFLPVFQNENIGIDMNSLLIVSILVAFMARQAKRNGWISKLSTTLFQFSMDFRNDDQFWYGAIEMERNACECPA